MKITTTCKHCNQSFEHEHWQNRKYCGRPCYTKATTGAKREFTEEWKQNISKAAKGRQPWNKGVTGNEYAEHYSNGFKGGFYKGIAAWNKGLTGEEYTKHYPNGFNGGGPKGQTPWNAGKKLSKEHKMKISKTLSDITKGIPKSKEHRMALSRSRIKLYKEGKIKPPNIGKTLPKEYRMKISETRKRRILEGKIIPLSGENNPMWQGGKCPYYGYNWYKQRRKTLKRDKGICQNCGNDGNIVHHIIPLREYIDLMLERYTIQLPNKKHMRLIPYESLIPKLIFEEANNLKNLVTCCAICHPILDKKNW